MPQQAVAKGMGHTLERRGYVPQICGSACSALATVSPERVAEAVQALDLRYVVLTAVARDDLPDHGACLFTGAMAAIRARNPLVSIEVLTPDFWGGFRDETAAIAAQRQRLAPQRHVRFRHRRSSNR